MNSIQSRCGEWMRSKPARLLLLCMISGMLVCMLSGAAVAKFAVTIEDTNRKTLVYTSESDPMEILRNEKIALGAHDTITFSGFEGGVGTLRINRASLVQVKADGAEKSVYIAEGTVADALKKLDVVVNDADLINVSLAEPIKAEMTVEINRVEYKTVTKTTAIPFEVRETATQTLKAGSTRVLRDGKEGQRVTEVRQTLLDGKVTQEETLSETITAEPVAAEILVGNPNAPTSQLVPAQEIALDANGNPVQYLSKVTGKATAYSALGKPTKLVPGCVAMDLSKYPRGSRLYIKTPDGSFVYGYSEVRDTGPAVNEGIILVDLFFGSYKESCLFGAKTMDIYILP